MHCDITTERGVNPSNVVSKIGNIVKAYAERRFKSTDFSRIIHIADTDGAFIPDSAIVEDSSIDRPLYSITQIRTRKKEGGVIRNRCKRENLNRLSSTTKVWNIPYQIYYMSCNLDHVLHGILNCTDAQKERNALTFAKKYRNDISGFLRFICESDFSVMNSYQKSWQYIREGLHSLERHTNLGLCFIGEDTETKDETGNNTRTSAETPPQS